MLTGDYSLGDGQYENGVYLDHDMPCQWKSSNLSYESLAAIIAEAKDHDEVCGYGNRPGDSE